MEENEGLAIIAGDVDVLAFVLVVRTFVFDTDTAPVLFNSIISSIQSVNYDIRT